MSFTQRGVQPLHVANNNDIVVALLKDERVNINSVDKVCSSRPTFCQMCIQNRRTALHYATSKEHADNDIIETLLDHKADPNAKDKVINSALMFTVMTNCRRK